MNYLQQLILSWPWLHQIHGWSSAVPSSKACVSILIIILKMIISDGWSWHQLRNAVELVALRALSCKPAVDHCRTWGAFWRQTNIHAISSIKTYGCGYPGMLAVLPQMSSHKFGCSPANLPAFFGWSAWHRAHHPAYAPLPRNLWFHPLYPVDSRLPGILTEFDAYPPMIHHYYDPIIY